MKLKEKTFRALRRLGETLPDNSNIEICLLDGEGPRVCHKFRVSEGVVHHSESHSDGFIRTGTGPLGRKDG